MKRRSTTKRKTAALTQSRLRSALTNGSKLVLANIDQRNPWCRRLRDLQRFHEADLGGRDHLSEGQRCIVRRASMLELQCEMLESKFALNGGEATGEQLHLYGRTSNSLRRLLDALTYTTGRKPVNVTPDAIDGLITGIVREGRSARVTP